MEYNGFCLDRNVPDYIPSGNGKQVHLFQITKQLTIGALANFRKVVHKSANVDRTNTNLHAVFMSKILRLLYGLMLENFMRL